VSVDVGDGNDCTIAAIMPMYKTPGRCSEDL